MNQERINQLALEVAQNQSSSSGVKHIGEDFIIRFATKFLAAVREEEIKDAVAWVDPECLRFNQTLVDTDKPDNTEFVPLFEAKVKELEAELADCIASNKAVEAALKDVPYKGAYADGVEWLKSRLEIDGSHKYDGIFCRDVTISRQDDRIAELEAENARLRLYEPAQRTASHARQEAIADAGLAYWVIGE